MTEPGSLVTTYWEDVAPMPPDAINPLPNVQFTISGGDDDQTATITLTATLDTTIFNASSDGVVRALRAWANWEIEQGHWGKIKGVRKHGETITVSPAWPTDVVAPETRVPFDKLHPTKPGHCACGQRLGHQSYCDLGLKPRTGEEAEAALGNPHWAHLLPGMREREL